MISANERHLNNCLCSLITELADCLLTGKQPSAVAQGCIATRRYSRFGKRKLREHYCDTPIVLRSVPFCIFTQTPIQLIKDSIYFTWSY